MPTPKGGTSPRRSPLKLVPGAEAGKLPSPPEHLAPDERAAWLELCAAPAIQRCGSADSAVALELIATALADLRRLRQHMLERVIIDEDTKEIVRAPRSYETTTESGGMMLRPVPELAAIATIRKDLAGLLGRFGLTPADITRVAGGGGPQKPKTNPLDRYRVAPRR